MQIANAADIKVIVKQRAGIYRRGPGGQELNISRHLGTCPHDLLGYQPEFVRKRKRQQISSLRLVANVACLEPLLLQREIMEGPYVKCGDGPEIWG